MNPFKVLNQGDKYSKKGFINTSRATNSIPS